MNLRFVMESRTVLNKLFDRTPIPLLQEVAAFSQARQEMLAGNLANVHTPGYRTRDLSVNDFQAKLRAYSESLRRPPVEAEQPAPSLNMSNMPTGMAELLAARGGSTAKIATTTQPEEKPTQKALAEVHASMRNVLYHDRTDIDLEKQVAEVTKNQYMHNMAVALMTNQFQLMQTAISERV
jgi:flagellar basal-body rod protein FlgB